MSDKLDALKNQYYKSVIALDTDNDNDMYAILPHPSSPYFKGIIRGVLELLHLELSEYRELLQDEEDDLVRDSIIEEISRLQRKLRICEEMLEMTYVIEEESTLESEDVQQSTLVFGKLPSGNIAFLNDLKRNVDEHYYPDVLKLLDQLETGELVTNPEKNKYLSSINKKLAGLLEAKEYQLRLIYKYLPNNMIYVCMIRVKKDTFVTKDKQEPIDRAEILAKDYSIVVKRIKDNDRLDELIIESQAELQNIRTFLNKSIKKGGKK